MNVREGGATMSDNESVFRVTAAILMLVGLAVRIYYQRQFRNVQRDAPRGRKRDEVYYYLVLGSFLLVFVYAGSTILDVAHIDIPFALRWIGAAIGVASLLLLLASHRALG